MIFSTMNGNYAEYLQGNAWKRRREQRLAIAEYKCAACGKSENVQVHHLTYARIFNEPMEDLLPLCKYHHDAAEDLILKGTLKRNGNVLFLATETIRLVLNYGKKLSSLKQPHFTGDGLVLINRKVIHGYRSRKGGYSKDQLAALGVAWPPVKKWLKHMNGKLIHKTQWRKFLLASQRTDSNHR